MTNSAEYLGLHDAGELLGVGYITLLRDKEKYGVEKVSGGGYTYGISRAQVKEMLEARLHAVQTSIDRLDSGVLPQRKTKVSRTSDRNDEMARLRFDELWTLEEIGQRFFVSRERVRQIIGNSGRGFTTRRAQEIIEANPDKTNGELAEMLGMCSTYISNLRTGRVPVKGDSSPAIGQRWEEWATNDLEEHGFTCELMNYGSPYDILLNDSLRVDVKACLSEKSAPSMKNTNPVWRFNTKGDRDNCDFYFCVTVKEDVFIIPSDAIPAQMPHLVFTYPTARPTIGKYQKYHERYDLLNGTTND